MDKRSVGWRSARPEDALEKLGEYKDGWLSFLKFLKSMLICAFSHRLKKKANQNSNSAITSSSSCDLEPDV